MVPPSMHLQAARQFLECIRRRDAEFVETEVLPLVEKQYNVKLTKNPEGRAALG